MDKKLIGYRECNCGAITLIFDDGTENHCKRTNLKKFGISLRGVKKEPMKIYMCDHCINHYGIDICECGSGKRYDKCCGNPMETLGVEYDGFSKIIENYG